MMRRCWGVNIAMAACFLFSGLRAQTETKFTEDFNQPVGLKKIGRGVCKVENGFLITKDAYASFGDKVITDYELKFSARTPSTEKLVQIWFGFRAKDREDRYIVGFKGGTQNDLTLTRLGYMGSDEFLGLRNLDFHPEPGTWYDFRVQVIGNRIRIFINNESLPRIDVQDKNSNLAPSGEVTLGGSWIINEFDNLTISPLKKDQVSNSSEEYTKTLSSEEREKKRMVERAAYHPLEIGQVNASRTEISLNGQWLFMPEYQLSDQLKAVSPTIADNDWHCMSVPNFWNPSRVWLHGEQFGDHAKGTSDNYYQQETERCENYTFDYKKTSAAWYRQWVELPASVKGKNIEVSFDAISKVAEVWINGTKVGSHVGMFGELRVSGTDLFKPGRNLIVVHVVRDYVKDISDASKIVDVAVSVEVTNKMLKDLAHGFFRDDPAGIWQPVKMIITEPVKITDVFIQPNLTGADFDITLKNNSKKKKTFSIQGTISEKGSKKTIYHDILANKVELNAGEEKILKCSVMDLQPKLWTPEHPNLYDFTFTLNTKKEQVDSLSICSGFRTFESKNGYFYLNGNRYWLRGGNHTAFYLGYNNVEMADKFFQLMKQGNMEVTRTHTTPYNELWMDAADRNGIGISFEGTWPWLMINNSMPEQKLINLWADEFLSLLKKYRNHPSLLFWTVNNEMKFYDNEPDFEKAKLKMRIISDVIKKMRAIDHSRPICFDSNYHRNEKKFGKDFYQTIDDGDIDDVHSYINWYNHTVFKDFKGEFQKSFLNPGRPLISQEMSTGYPSTELGHSTRFYTLVHQNPQSLIGNLAYEYNDPAYFLTAQSFITGELAEALRRTCDKTSGILHFALLTWFKNVYDPKTIEPFPTYYAVKRALQPVLVSAEIWGRHFYAGERLPARICIVNDLGDGKDLAASRLTWQIVTADNHVIGSGTQEVPAVKHYGREWLNPEINIPSEFLSDRMDAKLVLSLTQNGKVVSANEYQILLAKKEWTRSSLLNGKKIVIADFEQTKPVFDFLSINTTTVPTVANALASKADIYVFSGLDITKNCTIRDIQNIRNLIAQGGKVLILNSDKVCQALYPEYIKGSIVPTEGDIVNMEIPESSVFNGIEPMDLRYFNNNEREVPTVCHVAYKIERNPNVEALASHIKIHGYINGEMQGRSDYMKTIKGFPIIKIKDNGSLIISAMSLEKSVTDPVAGKLMTNLLESLVK